MNNRDDLVSVIIPVYNVRDYLEECLNSVINQTYRNIEIIIVDDGSTDGSSDICDIYKEQDDRIKVIHKKNGGLSSARNAGIEICSGDYISFVDSDDWIVTDMIETLIVCLDRQDADIVCCDYFSDENNIAKGGNTYKYDNSTAISMLLDEGGFKCYAWNKIYKYDLFRDIRYPEGELFEDIKTTYLLFKNSTNILYCQQAKYFYRLRENSITRKKFNEKDLDLINAINFVKDDAEWLKENQRNKLLVGYIYYYLSYLKKGIIDGGKVEKEIGYFQQFVIDNLFMIINSRNIYLKFKIELLILLFSKKFFKILLVIKTRG